MDSERISIHRGNATGPVIATADSFQGKNGITEIQLPELSTVVPVRHKHHTLPFLHGHTFFKVDGKQYQWKRHKELVEEGGHVVLAKFHASHDKNSRNLGSLIITPEGQSIANLAIITYMIDQERSDEGRLKVTIYLKFLFTVETKSKRMKIWRHGFELEISVEIVNTSSSTRRLL